MKTSVLIPVKSLSRAKSRLSGLLDQPKRKAFMIFMLRHVLGAVRAAGSDIRAFIVTPDPASLEEIRFLVADVIREDEPGQNEALTFAAQRLSPHQPLLTLSADLPLISPADITRLLSLVRVYDAILIPAKAQTGTNGIFLRKPLVVPYFFGHNSLQSFSETATEIGLNWTNYRSPGTEMDIDTVEDFTELVSIYRKHGQTLPPF